MMNILEAIGVFAFAISGAVVAMEEKFDLFGIYVMAAITAMGGGILRDAILNQGLPIFFTSQWTWGVIFIGGSLAIFLRKNILNKIVFVIIDAIGLAAFAISAASTMMEQGQNKMVILFAACVTGVGGGMIRDIMVNRKPAIFCYDIYYNKTNYELAYTVEVIEDKVVVVIMAGTRENFYEELKRYMK